MADSKAKDGAPTAAPTKARKATPRKTVSAASPKLPVKAAAVKAATPPAPIPAPVVKAPVAPVAAVKAPVRKAAPKPVAAPAPVAVKEAAEPPAPIVIEAAPVIEKAVAAAEEIVTTTQAKFKEGIKAMDATTKTIDAGKTAADQVQAMFGDLNDRAKGAMEKTAKIAQEVTDLSKGNVEAVVASTRVAAKGVESLSREAAEYGRKSFEDASAALKSFAEVRSPADLFRLQSDYARSYFDSVVAETSKMSEAFVKLAGEVAEPITNRYSVAAERVRSIAL
jgi:phasin family protein